MKALYQYTPAKVGDANVTITASPALANFTTANLYSYEPTKSYKTLDASGAKYVKYDAGSGKTFNVDSFFLNRFNFAAFNVQGSNDDFSTTPFDVAITGLTRDELYDPNTAEIVADNYMHYWLDLTSFDYRYLRLYIPAQTPLFETTYFKVGNMLIGNAVELWNPASGFTKTIQPNLNITTFDSGYETLYKRGKFFRVFEGNLNRISTTEYAKFNNGFNPFVLYLDWTSDNNAAYLVRNMKELRQEYYLHNYFNIPIAFREVV
jgi:hypothetical protein